MVIEQLVSWVYVIGMIVTCEVIDTVSNVTDFTDRLLVLLLASVWPATWAGVLLDSYLMKKLVQLYWRLMPSGSNLPRARARRT